MTALSVWPFFFEVNVLQHRARRERTAFVTIEDTGATHWIDHSGRFARVGGWGGLDSDELGGVVHIRGGRALTPEEEIAEKREFTIEAVLTEAEFGPIRALIESVGVPWGPGWTDRESQSLHALLEAIYWRHVNRFVHEPFDEADAQRPKE